MGPATDLRRAVPADLDAIDSIERASFDDDRFARRNLKRMLDRGRTEMWLAEQNGAAVGYLALSFRDGTRTARLYSLAIIPQARGQGVARALITRAIERAGAKKCRVLRLEVRELNAAARHLYEDCGFTLRGRRESYYGDGEAASLYEIRTGL